MFTESCRQIYLCAQQSTKRFILISSSSSQWPGRIVRWWQEACFVTLTKSQMSSELLTQSVCHRNLNSSSPHNRQQKCCAKLWSPRSIERHSSPWRPSISPATKTFGKVQGQTGSTSSCTHTALHVQAAQRFQQIGAINPGACSVRQPPRHPQCCAQLLEHTASRN